MTAVLALDVEDLDLDDRRGPLRAGLGDLARRRRPGCCPSSSRAAPVGRCSWPTGAPAPAGDPPPADLCPETGRGRLSYERAEYLFKQATGGTLRMLKAAGR